MANADNSVEAEQAQLRQSRSEIVAIAGLIVAGLLSGVGFVLAVLSQPGERPIATTVLSVVLSLTIGLAPVPFAIRALVRRRKWSAVVVTVAGIWVSVVSASWGPLISVLVLVASIVAIVFAWLHNIRSAQQPLA